MSMIMNHDMTSLMGQKIMQKNSLAMRRSLQKLSTGLRTKIADLDNTAGLAISETMRSRIGGMEKALNNSQDGISLIQTATEALDQTQSMLKRMRELSVQAANDTLTQQDRSYIQVEINEIRDAITLNAATTQFNRKRILSGDNAVLWSSTDDKVKAVVKGGLRSVDQFGQKYAVDGNYKITVNAEVGKAEIQKSDIFHVKHDDVLTDKNINGTLGVSDVSVSGDVPAGQYTLKLSQGTSEDAVFTGSFGIGKSSDGSTTDISNVFTIETGTGLEDNASILFEVGNVDTDTGIVTLRATASILSQEGTASTRKIENILLEEGKDGVNLGGLFGSDSVKISLNDIDYVQKGGKFTVNVSANPSSSEAIGVNISGITDNTAPDRWDNGPLNSEEIHYVLDGSKTGNKEISFRNYFINQKTGQVLEGNINLETNGSFKSINSGGKLDTSNESVIANFKAGYVNKVADGGTKLRDVDKFWNSEGVFILEQPKELTLTQGDGKQAKIMIYADDTLDDLAMKMNRAVAVGLGQSKYVEDATKFVSFVDSETSGIEAVKGTFVIRSVLTGDRGKITLSGNEDVLNAFSLNTLQEADEIQYRVSVRDAHDDSLIAQNVKITGNRLEGVIHKNIDVEFDPMLGITASWNDGLKTFELVDNTGGRGNDVILHLADNTTVFQTGAGEGDDVMINIGDMRSSALGLDSVNVMNQEAASHSISVIDKAIDRVSMQMAKLGAAQNRLEHHVVHLTDETEALVEANSRIRDTDYAKEILEFTRISILMQSNSAMLAQSNQIQQSSILSLMR